MSLLVELADRWARSRWGSRRPALPSPDRLKDSASSDAILISAALIDGGDNGTDEFIARNAWLYVSILGAGYFISRGLAKSGSYEPDADYNPADLGLSERVGSGRTDGR